MLLRRLYLQKGRKTRCFSTSFELRTTDLNCDLRDMNPSCCLYTNPPYRFFDKVISSTLSTTPRTFFIVGILSAKLVLLYRLTQLRRLGASSGLSKKACRQPPKLRLIFFCQKIIMRILLVVLIKLDLIRILRYFHPHAFPFSMDRTSFYTLFLL